MKRVLFVFLLCVFPLAVQAQEKLFANAEGWGRFTQGGKGGRQILVTNLNDSGPGSFRDAVSQKDPRIVVFMVSGTITVNSTILIGAPYITIAFQTAPGDGIQLKNANASVMVSMRIKTHDVFISEYKGRGGIFDEGGEIEGSYALDVVEGYNIYIARCSFAFSDDTVVQLWKHCYNVTIDGCLFAWGPVEALNIAGTKTGAAPAEKISIIRCILGSSSRRLPNFNEAVNSEFINNVVFNYRADGCTFAGGSQVDFRNNVLIPGYNTSPGACYFVESPTSSMKVYQDGNVIQGSSEYTFFRGAEPYASSTPVGSSGYVPMSTDRLVEYLAETAGPNPKNRDELDQKFIDDMLNGTGRWIKHEREVGGHPSLTGTTRTTAQWNAIVADAGGIEEALMLPYEGETEPPPPPDTVPPNVSIVGMSDFDILTGTVYIQLNATDNVGVVSVSLISEGRSVVVPPPYVYELNTTLVGPGLHTLTATAIDAAGNLGQSDAVTPIVCNGTVYGGGMDFDTTAIFGRGYSAGEATGYATGYQVGFKERRVLLGLSVDGVSPVNESLKELYGTGFGINLRGEVSVSPNFSMIATLGYVSFPADPPAGVTVEDGEMVTVVSGFKVILPMGAFRPFVAIDAGATTVKISNISSETDSISEATGTKFTWQPHIGFEAWLGENAAIEMSARYIGIRDYKSIGVRLGILVGI